MTRLSSPQRKAPAKVAAPQPEPTEPNAKAAAIARPVLGEIALMRPEQTEVERMSELASDPAVNAASLMHVFHGNILNDQNHFMAMLAGVDARVHWVKNGDMAPMEAMLVAQAVALQSIFTSLARRAQKQDSLRHYETFLSLGLKAQAQSRATIQALGDLKYPRHATFVKQQNVAHGHQQVNNGAAPAGAIAPAEKGEIEQSRLLEVDHGQSGGGLDTRAPATAKRGDPELAAVGAIHRTAKPRWQSQDRTQCGPRR